MFHNSPMDQPDAPDDPVPLFGSWPRIYIAALAWLAVVMGGIALFSRWPF